MINTKEYRARIKKIREMPNPRELSKVTAKFKCVTQYTCPNDKFELPITIEGTLISAGEYVEKNQEVRLPLEELAKVYKQWEGKKIYSHHNAFWKKGITGAEVPISAIVGRIITTSINEKDKAIDFIAEIMDRDIAFKIITGLIDSISVGIAHNWTFRGGMPTKINLEPKEASLVDLPRDEKAKFKPKEVKCG